MANTRSPVEDERPPAPVLRVVNPVLRTALTSPLARMAPGPLVVLEFVGRRTGRTIRIVVGWHDDGAGGRVVVTSAPWRLNFRGGAPVTVWQGGRAVPAYGTLVEDRAAVAAAVQRLLAAGTPPRALGLRVPARHRFTAADAEATRRTLVRLDVERSVA